MPFRKRFFFFWCVVVFYLPMFISDIDKGIKRRSCAIFTFHCFFELDCRWMCDYQFQPVHNGHVLPLLDLDYVVYQMHKDWNFIRHFHWIWNVFFLFLFQFARSIVRRKFDNILKPYRCNMLIKPMASHNVAKNKQHITEFHWIFQVGIIGKRICCYVCHRGVLTHPKYLKCRLTHFIWKRKHLKQ